jgi:hypothetical protein
VPIAAPTLSPTLTEASSIAAFAVLATSSIALSAAYSTSTTTVSAADSESSTTVSTADSASSATQPKKSANTRERKVKNLILCYLVLTHASMRTRFSVKEYEYVLDALELISTT